jgi:hypothetical protein
MAPEEMETVRVVRESTPDDLFISPGETVAKKSGVELEQLDDEFGRRGHFKACWF